MAMALLAILYGVILSESCLPGLASSDRSSTPHAVASARGYDQLILQSPRTADDDAWPVLNQSMFSHTISLPHRTSIDS